MIGTFGVARFGTGPGWPGRVTEVPPDKETRRTWVANAPDEWAKKQTVRVGIVQDYVHREIEDWILP